MEILDTAGTEQFTAMRDMYMKNGDGFILVYSITSAASLHDLLGLKERLDKVKPGAKIVLVANKSDLAKDRTVSQKQGQDIAGKWNCPIVETSAKDSQSVEAAFNELLALLEGTDPQQDSIKEKSLMQKKKRSKKCLIV